MINKTVSFVNHVRYYLTERILLWVYRFLHKNDTKDLSPLISIYTPTYNRSQMLKDRAIPSVLKQTYTNFEYIIVGDCCTDDTEEVVKSFNDDRIKYVNLSKRGKRYPETAMNHWYAGPVVASNKALSLVSGQYIARLDDDDIWTGTHLEVLLDFLKRKDREFVCSNTLVVEDGIEEIRPNARGFAPTHTWLYKSYLKFFKYNINCWRKSWNKVNDTDIYDRMLNAGVRIGFLSEVTGLYIPRPGTTKIGSHAYLEDEEKTIREMI